MKSNGLYVFLNSFFDIFPLRKYELLMKTIHLVYYIIYYTWMSFLYLHFIYYYNTLVFLTLTISFVRKLYFQKKNFKESVFVKENT
jgi:hypothetical protein